jgi:hypothetical protein
VHRPSFCGHRRCRTVEAQRSDPAHSSRPCLPSFPRLCGARSQRHELHDVPVVSIAKRTGGHLLHRHGRDHCSQSATILAGARPLARPIVALRKSRGRAAERGACTATEPGTVNCGGELHAFHSSLRHPHQWCRRAPWPRGQAQRSPLSLRQACDSPFSRRQAHNGPFSSRQPYGSAAETADCHSFLQGPLKHFIPTGFGSARSPMTVTSGALEAMTQTPLQPQADLTPLSLNDVPRTCIAFSEKAAFSEEDAFSKEVTFSEEVAAAR